MSDPFQDPVARALQQRVQTVFQGDPEKWEPLLLGLAGGLHVLLEDRPGLGKTTLAQTLASALGLQFGRIQGTPDLLPGDVLGMTIYEAASAKFLWRRGPVFTQFLLVDELNRASPRTQAALLEAMAEGAVTVDGVTRPLPEPFFLVATQNPWGSTGTFPLPEAQIDRFGLVCSLGYPDTAEWDKVLQLPFRRRGQAAAGATPGATPGPAGGEGSAASAGENSPVPGAGKTGPLLSAGQLKAWQAKCDQVQVSPELQRWMVRWAEAARRHPDLVYGPSPRATQHWQQAARAAALLRGRSYLMPEDLARTVVWTLAHRLPLSPQARLDKKTHQSVFESMIRSLPWPVKGA